MNVKNGIASSTWLPMIPNNRCGSACSSSGCSNPISNPMNANSIPFAASANATGKPVSSITARPANITGAIISCVNCICAPPVVLTGRQPSPVPRSGAPADSSRSTP